ncbi:LptF/LptG family permease [Planctomycetales bacterium ZRK34]|nr:LptF/LptG family permease [Planctomycetales bacterium ZRK34]
MPLTLYWYILRDLLKLLITSTLVLVIVMSFGFAIKPISDGLLGPWQLVKVIGYTMPGMLTFAMPFAVAFSTTLVFFRLSQDNEIIACAVGGISYRELLTPVLVLGLVLTLGLFWLSNWVVPKFWQLVAREIEQDVARLVIRQIERGETVSFGNLLLYADQARDDVEIEPRPADVPTPYNRLVLDGVAVAKIDRENILRADYTAERAVVDLYHDPTQDRTYATMLLSNVTINDPDSGTLITVKRQPVEPQEIESPFEQKPKFLSLPRLKKLVADPERSSSVRKSKRALIDSMAGFVILQKMNDALIDGGSMTLISPQGQRYELSGPLGDVGSNRLRLRAVGNDKVVVRARVGDLTTQRIEAESGTLEVVTNDLAEEPRMNLKLERVRVIDQDLPTPSTLRQVTLPLLRMDEPVLAPLRGMTIQQVMNRAAGYEDAPAVELYRKSMVRVIGGLMREVTSRLHERAAMAVNCLLVALLGAVMSMLLRQQTPLAIFFWCFMPTIVAFLTISSGQNMIGWHDTPIAIGMAMAWAGNVGLIMMIVWIYMRLCRN